MFRKKNVSHTQGAPVLNVFWFLAPSLPMGCFLIRKKYFSHRQGGNRKQGSNTHCGRQLPVYGGNLSASSKQGASKQPANKQQQAASKQPASKQQASSQQASKKQAASKQQAISSKLPTTMCVNSMFHPCLWGKLFFLIIFSHRQGGNQEAKHIEDGGSLPMGNVVLPKQCPSKVYSNCTQMNIFLNCVYCKQIVFMDSFFPTWSNKQW